MHEYQSLLVLQGRSIAKNLGKILFQIIEKDDVRVQIRSNFYVLKLCLIEFVERTIENSLKVSKNHQWWFLAIFDHF